MLCTLRTVVSEIVTSIIGFLSSSYSRRSLGLVSWISVVYRRSGTRFRGLQVSRRYSQHALFWTHSKSSWLFICNNAVCSIFCFVDALSFLSMPHVDVYPCRCRSQPTCLTDRATCELQYSLSQPICNGFSLFSLVSG